MEEEGNRELYRRRKCTVEPVFGQITVGMGFRRYFYRGRQKVRSEWNLVCAAFNIKKIAALKASGKVVTGESKGKRREEFSRADNGGHFLHEIAGYLRLGCSHIAQMRWDLAFLPHFA